MVISYCYLMGTNNVLFSIIIYNPKSYRQGHLIVNHSRIPHPVKSGRGLLRIHECPCGVIERAKQILANRVAFQQMVITKDRCRCPYSTFNMMHPDSFYNNFSHVSIE